MSHKMSGGRRHRRASAKKYSAKKYAYAAKMGGTRRRRRAAYAAYAAKY